MLGLRHLGGMSGAGRGITDSDIARTSRIKRQGALASVCNEGQLQLQKSVPNLRPNEPGSPHAMKAKPKNLYCIV